MAAEKIRPVRRGLFPNSSWCSYGEPRILMAWGYPGVGTPCRLDCHTASMFCGTISTSKGHGFAVDLSIICPREQWEEPGSAVAWAQLRSWIWLGLEASFGEAMTASGEDILEGGTLDWGRKGRQKSEISARRARGYIRKEPVDRNATWRCTYCEIKTDMSGEGRHLERRCRQMPKKKKRGTYMIEKTKKKWYCSGQC